MEYETDSVDALEKYAIVQFVKGCVFDSSKNPAGKITRNLSYVVPSFGERRWNKPGSYDQETQKYYGAEKPTIPVVYLTDHPAGAFVTGTGVKNASLEFKTCIYKAIDVPTETRRDNIGFAKPITCFEWQNAYVYDFDNGKFQTRLADFPIREEPYARLNVFLLVTFVTFFTALALITLSRLRRIPQPRDRC